MFKKSAPPVRPEELAPAGKLAPEAIEQFSGDARAVEKALKEAAEGAPKAALAIVAGLRGLRELAPRLMALLDDEGVAGRAGAWALGRLGGADVERALVDTVASAGIVRRENAYGALATLAAVHGGAAGLADAMAARTEAEIERAKGGRSGLGDRALRVLAVLGDKRVEDLAKRVIDGDRFANRVELDRLRKVMARDGRDTDTLRLSTGPWTAVFADDLVPPPAPQAAEAGRILTPGEAANRPAPAQAAAGKGRPPQGGPPPKGKAPAPPPAPHHGPTADAYDEVDEPPPPPAKEIAWSAFLSGPEVAALPARAQPMAAQLGQLLDQVAAQAVGVPLAELGGQELVAVLLQVLPRALPPQHAQTALSPEALLIYEALARFLARTGTSARVHELVDAVRAVRKRLREQVQRSGLIDGPDYSDPPA